MADERDRRVLLMDYDFWRDVASNVTAAGVVAGLGLVFALTSGLLHWSWTLVLSIGAVFGYALLVSGVVLTVVAHSRTGRSSLKGNLMFSAGAVILLTRAT